MGGRLAVKWSCSPMEKARVRSGLSRSAPITTISSSVSSSTSRISNNQQRPHQIKKAM